MVGAVACCHRRVILPDWQSRSFFPLLLSPFIYLSQLTLQTLADAYLSAAFFPDYLNPSAHSLSLCHLLFIHFSYESIPGPIHNSPPDHSLCLYHFLPAEIVIFIYCNQNLLDYIYLVSPASHFLLFTNSTYSRIWGRQLGWAKQK